MSPLRFAFDSRDFLENYWQKKPLLIRQALPNWHSPIDAQELAGLAMEPDIESRIVAHRRGIWELYDGPFVQSDFQRSDLWTLLVQGVDRLVPEVALLRQCTHFIPNWRFDDIMVSWAVDGAGVGPHFDRYDVFLLQGEGKRCWRLGDWCDDSTACIQHERLHLLESFGMRVEYVLEPGDVLYVPPGLAHWGIAQGPSMTYSLGFRAPAITNLMARMTDHLLEQLNPTLLLEDESTLVPCGRPGEITEGQRRNARRALIRAIEALDEGHWLGEIVTEHATDNPAPIIPDEPRPDDDTPLVTLTPWARVAWTEHPGSVFVYVNGEHIEVNKHLISTLTQLCSGKPIELIDGDDDNLGTLLDFLDQHDALIGSFYGG